MSSAKGIPFVTRFILPCPILCLEMCPHIYGTTAVCLSVMLSCLSCQKECTNIKALSEPPLEVCISTRRVTFCYPLSLVPLLLSFGGVRALSPPNLGGDVDTMCPEATRVLKYRNPSYLPESVSGNHARGSREIVMSATRHGAFCSTLRRRILRGGYTARRILRSGT